MPTQVHEPGSLAGVLDVSQRHKRSRTSDATRFARCVSVNAPTPHTALQTLTLLWTPVQFRLSELIIGGQGSNVRLYEWHLYQGRDRNVAEILMGEGEVTNGSVPAVIRSFDVDRVRADNWLWIEYRPEATTTTSLTFTVVPEGVR